MDTDIAYLPIQSLDIEAETEITFDLYVNLPLNQKYLLYRKKGQTLATEKLKALSTNNIKNFYIHKNDYREFVDYVAQRIQSLVGAEITADHKKTMQVTVKAILSSTFDGSNPAVYSNLIMSLNDITGKIISSVLESSSAYNIRTFEKFSQLAKDGTDFQKHPVNVTTLAVLLAFGIGYGDEKVLADMAMAGLLHDVGMAKLTTAVIEKAHLPDTLNQYDRNILYQHPEYALKILQEKNVKVSPLLETLIMQHHEEFNGFGYPQGLRGHAINELAQILRVADELDLLISQGALNRGNLKLQVTQLMDRLHRDKVIEPLLCESLRGLLV